MTDLHFPEPALKSIVMRYRWAAKYSAGLDLDDLSQVAREAVERARSKYEPDRGKSFTGFAWLLAAQAVHQHANEYRAAVRVPCHAAHGRKRYPVVHTNSITTPQTSVGAGWYNDADTLLDVWVGGAEPSVEADLDAHRTAARVRACIDTVERGHARRGQMLRSLYLDGVSQTELGAQTGVTRQAVQNMLVAAVRDFKAAWADAGWDVP